MVQTDNPDDISASTPTTTTVVAQPANISLSGLPCCEGLDYEQVHPNFPLMASVKCEDSVNEVQRPSVTLVAVVDKSSSMSGDKLASLKTTLQFIITKLSAKDTLGIVEYNGDSQVSLPLTKMDDLGKQKANSIVNALFATGNTNLCDGLIDGIRLIPQQASDSINSVLLMTDGETNVGVTTSSGILAKMAHALQDTASMSVSTFGYGSTHDADLLRSIANAAQGMYYHITSQDSIGTAFADCLGGLISVAAQGLELEFIATENCTIRSVAGKFSVSEVKPGEHFRVKLGNIQSGESREIIFYVDIPVSTPVDKCSLVKMKLNYFDVVSDKIVELESMINVVRCARGDLTEDLTRVNPQVDLHRNRILGAETLSKVLELSSAKDFSGASTLLKSVIETISSSISAQDPLCVNLLEELQCSLKSVSDQHYYRNEGSYRMRQMSDSYSFQRSSTSAPFRSSSKVFSTKSKEKMIFDSADFEMRKKSSSTISMPVPHPPIPGPHPPIPPNSVNVSPPVTSSAVPRPTVFKLKRPTARPRFDSCDFDIKPKSTKPQKHVTFGTEPNDLTASSSDVIPVPPADISIDDVIDTAGTSIPLPPETIQSLPVNDSNPIPPPLPVNDSNDVSHVADSSPLLVNEPLDTENTVDILVVNENSDPVTPPSDTGDAVSVTPDCN